MRIYLVLAFLALPTTAASAAPSLQCTYDGNKAKGVILNPDRTSKQCNHSCE